MYTNKPLTKEQRERAETNKRAALERLKQNQSKHHNVQNENSFVSNKRQKTNGDEGQLQIKYNENGYRQFKEDGQWKYTHRRVAEKKLGRDLNRGEVVHHINKIKQDNRPHNLVVLEREIHDRVHQSKYHEKRACFKCGRTSHWAQDCYASRKWNGHHFQNRSNRSSGNHSFKFL